jgi:hypothetical protein
VQPNHAINSSLVNKAVSLEGNISMLKRLFIIYLITLPNASYADEIPVPEFSGEAIKYTDPYGGELILNERTPAQLKFWFRIIGGNHHQCHMSGIATSRDNETYKYAQYEQTVHCALSIIVLDNSVVLIDNSDQCKQISCGQRAGINGAVFHRAK